MRSRCGNFLFVSLVYLSLYSVDLCLFYRVVLCASIQIRKLAFFFVPAMAEIHDQFDTILILDFGSQVR